MESISEYDSYKTKSPEVYVNKTEVDFLEANLSHCPFCYWKPFFEEVKDGWFVACQCGARMPGDDAQEAAAKWNVRPRISTMRENVWPVSREHWTGY